jgi:tetratricopeptide (TPR) repeat protein
MKICFFNFLNSGVAKTINEIIKGINLGETAVFCGAGISRDSGMPIVNQLVPYILQKLEVSGEHIKLLLDIDNNPNIPFEAFMESIHERYNPELIFDIYKQGEPNTNHILLAKLIKAGKIRTIVTTNFDKLIEKALLIEPNSMIQGKDYELLYKEKDFDSIDWNKDQIRLIKIHGSIDDKEAMAITIKQIASQKLSQARFAVIKNVFSSGNHKRVLILGYSSSDVFDLSPQIQAIDGHHKLVYYIQHKNISKVESILEQHDKNPFKRYYNSQRLYYNTGDLIKVIWESGLIKNEPYKQFTSTTNWQENIDKWHLQNIQKYSEEFRYVIPASIFFKMGIFKLSLKYYEQALKIAKEIGDKRGKEISLGNLGAVLSHLGEYRKALEYLEQALKIAKEIKNRQGEGFGFGSIGTLYNSLGEYRKAIEYYEQALKIAKAIVDKSSEGLWFGSLGDAYNKLGEYARSIEYYEHALKIAKEIVS